MKTILFGLAAAVATTAAIGTAHADRKLLVLLDASGSMRTFRQGSTTVTRFDAAKNLAKDRIIALAMQVEGLDGVAVYTFHGTAFEAKSAGYIDPTAARNLIDTLSPTLESTPLAGSMCQAIDTLVALGPGVTKFLEVDTDGHENSTPDIPGGCGGPPSTSPDPPFSAGSWHHKVWDRADSSGIEFLPTLFDTGSVTGFAALSPSTVSPEQVPPQARALAVAGAPTDAQFFTALAQISGSSFRVIRDLDPLPVFGDLNNNQCVDHTDAIVVARKFGKVRKVAPALDLNADGKIGFADYSIVLSQIQGNCGVPDPLQSALPISCKGNDKIVINGKLIETEGTAIVVRGACNVTIRNSRIIAGDDAIHIDGTGSVHLENTHVAGENAIFMLRGDAELSAKSSIITGKQVVRGKLKLEDRGGNIFE